jgi:hypothetical protein
MKRETLSILNVAYDRDRFVVRDWKHLNGHDPLGGMEVLPGPLG